MACVLLLLCGPCIGTSTCSLKISRKHTNELFKKKLQAIFYDSMEVTFEAQLLVCHTQPHTAKNNFENYDDNDSCRPDVFKFGF